MSIFEEQNKIFWIQTKYLNIFLSYENKQTFFKKCSVDNWRVKKMYSLKEKGISSILQLRF